MAFADFEEQLEFGSELQETLGHFWALEQNLDENNAELAIVHATHPIAELYDSMSEKLADNPEFDYWIETYDLESGGFDESGVASFNVMTPTTVSLDYFYIEAGEELVLTVSASLSERVL